LIKWIKACYTANNDTEDNDLMLKKFPQIVLKKVLTHNVLRDKLKHTEMIAV